MRIDIGPEGRVIGTKRVSPEGSVSGLAPVAGQDVLIVVPQGRPEFMFSARDYVDAAQKFAKKSATRAGEELLKLRARVPPPREALRMARRELAPKRILKRVPSRRDAEIIIRRQVRALRRAKQVKAAERRLRGVQHQMLVARKWIEKRVPMVAAPKPRARARRAIKRVRAPVAPVAA